MMRKLGVERIEVDGLKFELSDLPQKGRKTYILQEETYIPGGIDAETPIPEPILTPDSLTEEQLLFYSSSGGVNLGPGETL